jgi:hypothetical protein
LLSEAYTLVADVFVGVDHAQAAKWRRKAGEQAALAKSAPAAQAK